MGLLESVSPQTSVSVSLVFMKFEQNCLKSIVTDLKWQHRDSEMRPTHCYYIRNNSKGMVMSLKSKILIVDDEIKNLELLRAKLENEYELVESTSGLYALEVIHRFDPAVILLDVVMPEMDGYQLTRTIRKNPQWKTKKIILLSRNDVLDDKSEGYRAGADDYLSKPFNHDELNAKLDTYIKLHNFEELLIKMDLSLGEQVMLKNEELESVQKFARLGRNVREIVHQLKNPLTIMKFYLEDLRTQFPSHDTLMKIERAADRIVETTNSILEVTAEHEKGHSSVLNRSAS